MFRATVSLSATIRRSVGLDFGTRSSVVPLNVLQAFTEGSGDNQATDEFFAVRTLATGGNEDLNLNAALASGGVAGSDSFGTQIAFTTIRMVYFAVDPTSVGTIIISPSGTHGFAGPLSGTAPTTTIQVGGCLLWLAPISTGWTVDSTHNRINIATGSAFVAATYSVGILGSA